MRRLAGLLLIGCVIWCAPHTALAIAPPYKSDQELSEYPLIVIGSWDKAQVRRHELVEGNVCKEFEAFTELTVHRVLKGNITTGKHTLLFGYGVGWRQDGTGLRTYTSTDLPGDVDDVTKLCIWFLDKERSWDSADETFYYHLPNYRAIQPVELEPFFTVLAGKDPDLGLSALLDSGSPLVIERTLRHICGGVLPWPNDDDEPGYTSPSKRGRVLSDHADAVQRVVGRDAGEVRALATSVYAELAGTKCVKYMRALLSDRDASVRATAAGILLLNKDNASLDAMRQAVSGLDDGWLAGKLIEAFSRCEDRRVVPVLISFLQNDESAYAGIPAVKARERLAALTGHWFPYDVAAATKAWEEVQREHDPQRQKQLLQKLLPGEQFPVVAELVVRGEKNGQRRQAIVRLRNTTGRDVVMAKLPNWISESWPNGGAGGTVWADSLVTIEDFITLRPGDTLDLQLSLTPWFLDADDKDRTLELSFENNGNSVGVNAWIGKLEVRQPVGEMARFTARIEFVEPKGKREAVAVPIGVDPRWLVGIQILSIELGDAQFASPGQAHLLIHSPVKTFLHEPDELTGKLFRFTVRREDGAYRQLEAEEIERD